ncbi:hypothetical protein [Paenibacillus dakarensis]|uniref:hypothetical protein n=1 Tax=Paenibacillus dakarensis TaxID=1527293 RepID=UPI0006D5B1D0|nr:hypothetical protein [Paenibacillus dakarensis]
MSSSVSIQLTAQEMVFLLQLLEFPEAERLALEFRAFEEAAVSADYERIKRQLKEAGLISLDNQRITLELSLLELLQACKFSSAAVRLESSCPVGNTCITYGFVSASGVTEIRWASDSGEVHITSLESGLEELLTRMGTELELPVTTESSDRIQLHAETFQRLYTNLVCPDQEILRTILEKDNLLNTQAGSALYSSLLTLGHWGTYQVSIRGVDIHSNTMRFMGGPEGLWVFIETTAEPVHGFRITETELIQSFYAAVHSTLSILTP